VWRVTAPQPLLWQACAMESVVEGSYKIVRTLPDGQRILVGSFEDVNEARKRIEALSKYWPGDYVIVRPHYEQRRDR
jgi:hypothetical protein